MSSFHDYHGDFSTAFPRVPPTPYNRGFFPIGIHLRRWRFQWDTSQEGKRLVIQSDLRMRQAVVAIRVLGFHLFVNARGCVGWLAVDIAMQKGQGDWVQQRLSKAPSSAGQGYGARVKCLRETGGSRRCARSAVLCSTPTPVHLGWVRYTPRDAPGTLSRRQSRPKNRSDLSTSPRSYLSKLWLHPGQRISHHLTIFCLHDEKTESPD